VFSYDRIPAWPIQGEVEDIKRIWTSRLDPRLAATVGG
jgi:hypothetical protein